MPLLEARHLSKSYGHGNPAVDDVSFTIERGETLGLVGESGSGKSTIARMVMGLIEPTNGEVLFDNQPLTGLPPRKLRQLRRRLQIVFQDPYAALNPRMRVQDIVAEPLIIHRACPRSELRPKVAELLRHTGLDESALPRYPHEFSGGQRQRINIARALALRPELIVLDEPLSALDVSVAAQIANLLRDLQREFSSPTCSFRTPCPWSATSPPASPCSITGAWSNTETPPKSATPRASFTRKCCSPQRRKSTSHNAEYDQIKMHAFFSTPAPPAIFFSPSQRFSADSSTPLPEEAASSPSPRC